MVKTLLMRLSLVGLAALGAACTVHQDEVPALAGPSEMALSVGVTATPDAVRQDGVSSSNVVVTLRDPNGAPLASRQVLLDLFPQVGQLSTYTVFTGSDGRASATYTAPLAPAFLFGGPPTIVSVFATPVGSNFETSASQKVTIRVTPPPAPAVVLGAPIASVTFSPAAPKVGQVVVFDASGSAASDGHSLTTFFWDFGDGRPQDEHGSDASHVYTASGTYTMVLGVVDDLGRVASDIHTIVVGN
jgi:PKD repeat protein